LGRPLETDREGRFAFELALYQEGRRVSFQISSGESADLDLVGPLTPGVHDLGDVVVRLEPVVVAGRVLDDEGHGLTPAHVQVHAREPNRTDWIWYGELLTQTDADGAFTIRSSQPVPSLLKITASQPDGRLQSALDVAPGTTDLILTLSEGRSLRGRLLTEATSGLARCRLVATGDNGMSWSRWADPQGRFSFEHLTATTVDLAVEVLGMQVKVDKGVAVPNASDPEIAIDLRGLLHALLLHAVDQDERPLARESLMVLSLDGSFAGNVRSCDADEQGLAELLLPASIDRFRVWSRGRRSIDLTWRPERQEVRLGRGIAVQLELARDTPLPASPYSLAIQLQPVDDEGRFGRSSPTYHVNDQLTAKGSVPMPGTYRIKPLLNQNTASGGATRELAWLPDGMIQVLDRDGEQTFQIHLHPDAKAAIEATVAKLRR
jgi:hypothetical protein